LKRVRIVIALLILALSVPQTANGWSRKGHVLITRAAVKLLLDDPSTPLELKVLLREGMVSGRGERGERSAAKLDLRTYVLNAGDDGALDPGLDLFSFRPDILVGSKSPVPAFESTEELMHYLNMEDFQPDPSRRKFLIDGSNKVSPKDLPRNSRDPRYKEAGFITFRTEQCYKSFVQSLKVNYSNEQVFLWLGFLAHYVGDAYQPYHASSDYRGYECPCNQDRKRKHNFHPCMEGLFFEDRELDRSLRERFLKYFEDELKRGVLEVEPESHFSDSKSKLDSYLIVQNALLSGYDYLPFLCRAGNASLKQGEFNAGVWFNYHEKHKEQDLSVVELKARRMAQAVLALKALILQAWQETEIKDS
jgi:hypothetical protein